MTVNTPQSTQQYTGNGVTLSFPIPFYFLVDTDLKVSRKVAATGVVSVLTLNSDYTLTGAGNNAGGSLLMGVAPASGDLLFIERNIQFVQQTAYPENNKFPSASHEKALDRDTMGLQQLDAKIGRALVRDPLASSYDIGGYGLSNVAAGVFPDDAVNVDQARDIAELIAAGIPGGVGTFLQSGVSPITRTFQDKMRDQYTIKDFGALPDGVTDASTATQRIKTSAGGTAIVRYVSNAANIASTYAYASLGSTDFDGLILDAPQGVTLQLPTSAGRPLQQMNVSRQTRILWMDIGGCDYYPRPKVTTQRDKVNFIGAGDLRQQKLTPISGTADITYRSIANLGTDTFGTTGPTTTASGNYIYGSGFTLSTWYGGFISVSRNETYSATFDRSGNGYVGVMFRHTGGYSVWACDPSAPDTTLIARFVKPTGGSVSSVNDVDFPGRLAYSSYSPARSVWGVTIKDNDKALITLNGRAITTPLWNSGLGDIIEVGFVWQPTASGSSCGIYDMMIELNSDPLGSPEIPEVRIFGDSTSEYLLGMWQDDLADMLDHTFGVKVGLITNYAVAGTNSANVVSSIATNGLGVASYVVVAIGTNDVQGGSPLSGSDSNLRSIINTIKTAGRVPVIVLPYMWYGQAQAIAGRGQPSTNYNAGFLLRSRWMRICADLGAVLVDPTRELPEPKPSYVTTNTQHDPLVRDNIHQSALGYKLYAWAIARAIASYHSQQVKTKVYGCAIPADWMQNGWTRGSGVKVWRSDDGQIQIQGNFAAGTKTAGTVVMNLPRWARPTGAMNFVCSSDGGYLAMDVAANGNVSLGTVPGAFNVINLNNIIFNTN